MSDSAALIQNGMNYVDDYIAHYGVGHLDGGHSGRYPWNSGKNKDKDSSEYKQKAYTNGHGRLSKAGKERYGFDDAAKSLRKFIEHPKSGGQLTDYDFTWYRAKGLDGFKDSYRTTLEKNPDLKKSLDDLVDYFNKIEKDGVKLNVNSAFEQLEERVNQWYMQELFGIKHSAIDYVDDYIAHYGRSKLDGAPIGSGRHHLGSGEDPYQDYPEMRASHQSGAKLSTILDKVKQHGSEKKAAKSEAQQQKKAEDEAAKKESETKKKEDALKALENKKFELMRSNDLDKILKNQELFTTNELQSIIERTNKLKQLKDLTPKQKTAIDKIDAAFGSLGKAANWINTGVNFAKSIQNMKGLAQTTQGKQTVTLGQKYAAQILAQMAGKKFNDIDAKQLNADLSKLKNVNQIVDIAKGKGNSQQNNGDNQQKKKDKK